MDNSDNTTHETSLLLVACIVSHKFFKNSNADTTEIDRAALSLGLPLN